LQAWQAWHSGDANVCALKFVTQIDICDSKQDKKGKMRPERDGAVKTFWHLRFLCTELDKAAGIAKGTNPSLAELNVLFSTEAVTSSLPTIQTKHKRERRTQELGWETVAKLMRDESADKRQRHAS
jgi:hypothetical protein